MSDLSQRETSASSPVWDYSFRPRSVAIVGASSDPSRPVYFQFQQAMINSGYRGEIHFISRSDDDILGIKTYRSIQDVPGPVDYVIAAIPAATIPHLMRECVDKNVRVVHLFTAGFSETESQGGGDFKNRLRGKHSHNWAQLYGSLLAGSGTQL